MVCGDARPRGRSSADRGRNSGDNKASSQMSTMSHVGNMADGEYAEELIVEYLQFRGFAACANELQKERAVRKDTPPWLRVEAVVERVLHHASALDAPRMTAMWGHLARLLLCTSTVAPVARQLEGDLFRVYMVNAINASRFDALDSFLQSHVAAQSPASDWTDWLGVGLVGGKARELPRLRVYFTDEWRDRFEVSLLNAAATAVSQCPEPRIAQFEAEARGIEEAEARIAEGKRRMIDVSEDLVMTAEQLAWLQKALDDGDEDVAERVISKVRERSVSMSERSPAQGDMASSPELSPWTRVRGGMRMLRDGIGAIGTIVAKPVP